MKKAIFTGILSGVVISGILIAATYIRAYLPDTVTANFLFVLIFFLAVVVTLWYSLHRCCRWGSVRWLPLSLTGVISSIMAALLVTCHGFLNSPSEGLSYLNDIIRSPGETTLAGTKFDYKFSLLNNSLTDAFYHFRELILLLLLLSIAITAIFYLRNRRRLPYHHVSDNHELIF